MASVTHDGQTFLIDGRRIWVLAASIHYARVAPERWEATIAAAQQAGFNAIDTACPWSLHEPRRGKYSFDGQTDVRRFIELCGKAGMRVILRPGPFIGHGYDGGGLPPWLAEIEGLKLRQSNELFTGVVTQYFRKLIGAVSDLQATSEGPILLVESEHAWVCANEEQAATYLHEITRVLRESGVSVPIFNSNDLWQPAMETIDTWRGFEDMLGHMRQLRLVQPSAPRIVSTFDASQPAVWGVETGAAHAPQVALQRLAQVLAGGAQPIVDPFHGGTNFGFMGGRFAGASDRFATTSAAAHAPLGEVGARTPLYHALRRLITFSNNFAGVFTELDPEYHPITLHPAELERKGGGRAVSIVTLAGRAGRVAFVFATPAASARSDTPIQLLLHDGTSIAVLLGKQAVGWYLFDADLAGAGRLDFANLCPFAVVDRSLVVMHGPANSPIHLSIGSSTFRGTVPNGPKPLVAEHRNLTLVICNQTNIDTTFCDRYNVYIGANGFTANGDPIAADAHKPVWVISKGALMRKWQPGMVLKPEPKAEAPPPPAKRGRRRRGSAAKSTASVGSPVPPALPAPPVAPPPAPAVAVRSGPATISLRGWSAAPATDFASGSSPRFATLEGPRTLVACGAHAGYGWYRVQLRSKSARKRLLALPFAADRIHLYIDGKIERIIGVGPGASLQPFELKLPTGEVTITALADNLGRSADGTDLDDPKGIFGHLYEVKPMRAARPKVDDAALVHPFALRQYIAYRTFGQLSDARQVIWRFSHAKKTPILLDIHDAMTSGTIVLNDEPVAYYAGATGSCIGRVLLDPSTMGVMRRGKNVLRFAPDPRQENGTDEIAKKAMLYECVDALSDGAKWSFARWEPPLASAFKSIEATNGKSLRGAPCWWRAQVDVTPHELPRWFDANGLSKGQVFVNGKNLGRYFTATSTGKAVGPQRRLSIPDSMLKIDHSNEIAVFDEHGCAPTKTAIVARESGDLD
jgi:hypothetical protein